MSLVFSQILEQLNLSKTATLGTETGAIVDINKSQCGLFVHGDKKCPL